MLYQQGTQRIEVIVRKDAGLASKGANEKPADQVSEGQPTSTSSTKQAGTYAQSKQFLRVNITHGLAVSKQLVGASINYALQGLGDKYGDQSLQENISRTYEIYQDGTNFASSVAMGATYGAAGGPLGIALGTAFGLISATTSIAFKYAGRERDFNYKVFKENNAIEYNRARASINLTAGRLR